MDHNLNDSLNLESDIGSMDFDHSGVVVNQEDITLETTDHDRDMPMELENIELQPTLMDTGNEEIIVSDFMSEQFTLQEYNTQDYTSKVTAEVTETVDANQLNILTSHSDSMIDLKFDADALSQGVAHEVTPQPKFIQVKAAVAPTRTMKKESLVASSMPRQVAIAPKPPCSVVKKPFVSGGKQYAIAPKPVTLVTNKGLMKMSLTGQGTSKTGNAVLTQIGKQLVMVPATGGQKLKLVTSSGSGVPNMKYAQLVTTKQTSGSTVQKPLLGKFIVQGQSNTDDPNQPAVITKIVPGVNTTPGARYVMQQKTVPITIGGTKVLMASPTKQGIELKRGIKFRNPIISLQSSTQKSVIPVTSQVATTTKKVVITSNPQNVILKTTAPPKTPQVSKEGTVIMQGQKSQLHQINVPGKGIQYIRLITNPTPAPQKTTSKAQTAVSFVLADNKVTTKPQKKLVRIAPVAAKPSPSVTQQTTRSSQSLLAPLSPVEASVDQTDAGDVVVESVEVEKSVLSEEYSGESGTESKTALRALLGETEETDHLEYNTMQEVEVEFETKTTRAEQEVSNSMMDVLEASNTSEDHPLIVIPSNYSKQNQMRVNSDIIFTNEAKDYPNIQVDVEGESVSMPYLSPKNSQALSETDNNMAPGDLEARPRKACNCTKSQCLKLYCDCFANGEFCNQCNCNNCHNNLDNEGLRQKAIRACLDRNPNAFRPKIGKSKSGGPEIIRRHNKGCNCKRSGCLKNYCECYEAKIACTTMCKCVGCRNVEETLERRRDALRLREKLSDSMFRPPPAGQVNEVISVIVDSKQPCSFMTSEVIEAVCQCLIAAAVDSDNGHAEGDGNEDANVSKQDADPMRDVIEEFARCLQDIISASHQSSSVSLFDEGES